MGGEVRNQPYDFAVKTRYEKVGQTDLPDHKKSGYPRADYLRRKADFHRYLKRMLATLKGSRISKNPIQVLDVGCGNGAFCEISQPMVDVLYGADISSPLLLEGKQKFSSVRFAAATCYDLPFKDQSFDMVICLGLLQIVSDYRACLRELLRVLKPVGGGLIEFLTAFTFWDKAVRVPLYSIRGQWSEFSDLGQVLTTGNGRSDSIRLRARDPREVRKFLSELGVHKIQTFSSRFGLLNETNTVIAFYP
jgi:ubiquinone/menaquinone biosynthesis C-methylase UbiE